MIDELLHNLELLIVLYIVSAPICTYQAWRRTAHSSKQRRLFLRTLSVGFFFTPGVVGVGHGVGILPAWIGLIEGMYFFGKAIGSQLLFVNAIALTVGFFLAIKFARSFEDRKDGKNRNKYKFSA